jgi:hypothetical protein
MLDESLKRNIIVAVSSILWGWWVSGGLRDEAESCLVVDGYREWEDAYVGLVLSFFLFICCVFMFEGVVSLPLCKAWFYM